VRDHPHHNNAQQRRSSTDKKTREARNTDFTGLSCDSNLRGKRAIDTYRSTVDRKSARKNVGSGRVNLLVKKICAACLK
jgi:hypothetical protein